MSAGSLCNTIILSFDLFPLHLEKINSPRTERGREREGGREREAQREGERERERASVAGQGVMCSITIPIEPAGC